MFPLAGQGSSPFRSLPANYGTICTCTRGHTRMRTPQKFRRFPATCNTLLCRVQKGLQPPLLPYIFPTRSRRFDTLQPSESSKSLLLLALSDFPRASCLVPLEIFTRGGVNFPLRPLIPRDRPTISRGRGIYRGEPRNLSS